MDASKGNVLLTHEKVGMVCLDLVIVDLADCVTRSVAGHSMIGTNEYRAPEVSLGKECTARIEANAYQRSSGLLWNESVDIFSLGCVLAELCIGRRLFKRTDHVQERMLALEAVVEPIPVLLAQHGMKFFPGLFVVERNAVHLSLPGRKVEDVRDMVMSRRQSSLAVSYTF